MNEFQQHDGRKIHINGAEHVVVGLNSSTATLLDPCGTMHAISQDDFRRAINEGRVREHGMDAHVRLSNPEEANEHRFRQKVLLIVEKLTKDDRLTLPEAREEARRRLADDPTYITRQRRFPSLRTIQYWFEKQREKGSFGLVPQSYRAGNRKDRHDDWLEEIALDVLDAHFFTSDRLTITDIQAAVTGRYVAKCAEIGIKPGPHGRRVIERIIERVPHDEALKRRLGVKESRKHRIKAVRYASAEAPLDVVELDCTTADVFVVDREGQVIGRPTICAIIDVATGFPIGLQLDLDAPDSLLVARTIKESLVC
jgi:putative transposase